MFGWFDTSFRCMHRNDDIRQFSGYKLEPVEELDRVMLISATSAETSLVACRCASRTRLRLPLLHAAAPCTGFLTA